MQTYHRRCGENLCRKCIIEKYKWRRKSGIKHGGTVINSIPCTVCHWILCFKHHTVSRVCPGGSNTCVFCSVHTEKVWQRLYS
ncbi:unnamed protein product [Leptidea sinapis]|uniref:Uncharacterized protein n=1 Tax=Leptidea sinapis TaxID=189913 RepID=A0A5E4QNB4_9NEOP|nr:unnamed protein product [Leptidea sinapis]